MKKFIKYFVFLAVIVSSVSANAQWKYDLHGLQPKIGVSIEELRARSAIGVIGDIWYVDDDGAAGNGGRSWGKAVTTLTKALSLAGDFDVILVAPGEYEELDVLNITEEGLKIIGPGIDSQNQALIYVADSTNHAMTINANNVEIAGLGFTVNKDTYDAIRIATTVLTCKTYIHHCRFDGYGQGEYAIHTGTSYDSPDLVVEYCTFRSWKTAVIYANATRAIYRYNTLFLEAATVGFKHIPTGGSRPDQFYTHNQILGANSTDTGFEITNTPSALTYLITYNIIAGCSTSITSKATNDAVFILNYVGDASGGALVDPSS